MTYTIFILFAQCLLQQKQKLLSEKCQLELQLEEAKTHLPEPVEDDQQVKNIVELEMLDTDTAEDDILNKNLQTANMQQVWYEVL